VAEQSGIVLRAEVRLLGFGGGKDGAVDGSDGVAGAAQGGAAP
jgi:hypothetical protein